MAIHGLNLLGIKELGIHERIDKWSKTNSISSSYIPSDKFDLYILAKYTDQFLYSQDVDRIRKKELESEKLLKKIKHDLENYLKKIEHDFENYTEKKVREFKIHAITRNGNHEYFHFPTHKKKKTKLNTHEFQEIFLILYSMILVTSGERKTLRQVKRKEIFSLIRFLVADSKVSKPEVFNENQDKRLLIKQESDFITSILKNFKKRLRENSLNEVQLHDYILQRGYSRLAKENHENKTINRTKKSN